MIAAAVTIRVDPDLPPLLRSLCHTLHVMRYGDVLQTIDARLTAACHRNEVFVHDRSQPAAVIIRLRPEIFFALTELKMAANRRELGMAAGRARIHALLERAGLRSETDDELRMRFTERKIWR